MNDPIYIFLIRTAVVSLITAIISIILFVILCHVPYLYEIIIGYIASISLFSLGIILVKIAYKKSMKTFLLFVLGWMVFRFITIGTLIFLLIHFTKINLKWFILIFFGYYICFQALEIRKFSMIRSGGGR